MKEYIKSWIIYIITPGGIISAASVVLLALLALVIMVLLKKVPVAGILLSGLMVWLMS